MKMNFVYSRLSFTYANIFFVMLLMLIVTPIAHVVAAQDDPSEVTVWQSVIIPKGIDKVQQIYLALWDTDRGVKEGLVLFEKKRKHCVGRLSIADFRQLNF